MDLGRVGRVLLFVGLMGLPRCLFAAKIQLGDSSGGSPTPVVGSSVEVSFNPTVSLTVQPPDHTIDVLLDQLAEAINAASDGLYTADVPAPTVLEILRSTGEEIDDARFIENDPGIQSVAIAVDRPQLIAQIGAVLETPSSGMILVTLNDRSVAVWTTGLTSGGDVTDALVKAIKKAGFAVELDASFIVVTQDLRNNSGITRLGLRSTDPSIVNSDLALLPAPATVTATSAKAVHHPQEDRLP